MVKMNCFYTNSFIPVISTINNYRHHKQLIFIKYVFLLFDQYDFVGS